ncbi:hypothetical protein B484DRAFT_232146 [Ochromonadaceae sp. CCMP2298]|nr:hypothetical protein B484DRAFT_232146 [Ochromonadaceae sp. CCMP2298]
MADPSNLILLIMVMEKYDKYGKYGSEKYEKYGSEEYDKYGSEEYEKYGKLAQFGAALHSRSPPWRARARNRCRAAGRAGARSAAPAPPPRTRPPERGAAFSYPPLYPRCRRARPARCRSGTAQTGLRPQTGPPGGGSFPATGWGARAGPCPLLGTPERGPKNHIY